MTISEKEIYEDYLRFLRHEAMRANVPQDKVLELIKETIWKK